MSQFSGFVSIPEASQTLKRKKVKPITIVGLNTRHGFSEEKNNKIIDLNNRVQAIRAYLKQRGLKFNMQKMCMEAIMQKLEAIEKSL